MGYDRSQAKQEKKEKKGKRGGGGQSTAKKKYYSPDIPLRKVARMLEPGASSVKFVAQRIFEADRKLGAVSDVRNALIDLAYDGAGRKYGASVQALAQQAVDELTKLDGASMQAVEATKKEEDQEAEMAELERLTRPDNKK